MGEPQHISQAPDGRIILGHGAPQYSDRAYKVRRFKADPYDRFDPPRVVNIDPRETPTVVLFEDAETGILVTDVRKFETWVSGREGE